MLVISSAVWRFSNFQVSLGVWKLALNKQTSYILVLCVLHQQPQSHMPSQAFANCAMVSPQVSFCFRVEPPSDSCVMCLVFVVVFVFCFQVPMWLPCSPVGLNYLGLQHSNTFGLPWEQYVPPGDGLWLKTGVLQVTASPTALSRGASFYSSCCLPTIVGIWWVIQLWGGLVESPDTSAFPRWAGVFFQIVLHLMAQSNVNLW